MNGKRTQEDVFGAEGEEEEDEDEDEDSEATNNNPVIERNEQKQRQEFFSLRHIAKMHGVSNVSVLKWGRKALDNNDENKKKG